LLRPDAILRRKRKVNGTEAAQKTKNPRIEKDQSLAKEADPVNAPGQRSDPDLEDADREAAKDLEVERGPDLRKGPGLAEGRDQGTADADRGAAGPGAEAVTAGGTRETRRSGKDRRLRRRSRRGVGGLRPQRRRAKRASTRVKSQRKTRNIKSDVEILK